MNYGPWDFETTVGRDDETFSCLVKILALKKEKEKKGFGIENK